MFILLLGTNERKEHVEGDLHTIDEDETVLGGNEFKVDRMYQRPDLPRALACRKKIIPDLVANGSQRITVDQAQIGEENAHEDRAPNGLINQDLQGYRLSIGSRDLLVQPVVKVVSRGAMVDKTEHRQRDETLHVEGSSTNENLQ